MTNNINHYLSLIGLTFPENEREVKSFIDVHENYNYQLKEDLINPFKILDEIKREIGTTNTVTNIDYHKRTVLAAEIVFQLQNDNSLGHLKLQKLIFLCQNIEGMQLHTNFLRQAMGPYDPILMRSLDSQFKKNKWFEYRKDDFPKYVPLEKCGSHRNWFDKYFSGHLDNINYIIELFKNEKTRDTELVATLYACWEKGIEENCIINNYYLINKVYEWHESKSKYSQIEIETKIEWMKNNSIVPLEE